MTETNLRKALDRHLSTMTDVPVLAWENKSFDQDNVVYLSQFLLPAETQSVGIELGGSDVLSGIYQVTVNVPKGSGKAVYLAETEKVKSRFARGLILSESGTRIVIHKVWSNSASIDENYYRVPISIRYRAI